MAVVDLEPDATVVGAEFLERGPDECVEAAIEIGQVEHDGSGSAFPSRYRSVDFVPSRGFRVLSRRVL